MANKKKEVYKVKPLNENKRNIIAALIDEYDIETADDIQEALKDLLGGTIKSMMESEMDEHLGYESYERSDNPNYRNGTKKRPLEEIMANYSLMYHKTATVHLNLRSLRSVREIFRISTVRSSVCMREDLRPDRFPNRLRKSMVSNVVKVSSRM